MRDTGMATGLWRRNARGVERVKQPVVEIMESNQRTIHFWMVFCCIQSSFASRSTAALGSMGSATAIAAFNSGTVRKSISRSPKRTRATPLASASRNTFSCSSVNDTLVIRKEKATKR
jgi:hypothetical protein